MRALQVRPVNAPDIAVVSAALNLGTWVEIVPAMLCTCEQPACTAHGAIELHFYGPSPVPVITAVQGQPGCSRSRYLTDDHGRPLVPVMDPMRMDNDRQAGRFVIDCTKLVGIDHRHDRVNGDVRVWYHRTGAQLRCDYRLWQELTCAHFDD